MISINPDHDASRLAEDYGKAGRMQIRDFLKPADADHIHRILAQQTPWWLAFNEGSKVHQLPAEYLATLSQAQISQMLAEVNQRAKVEYQYLYQYYPMLSMYFTPTAPKLPILEVLEFLNSTPCLDFIRQLTGRADIRWADAQATLYRPGNFLKSHTDGEEGGHRVAAYVMNFTRVWERDWGGYLQFFNDDHDIEQSYRPIFNAINIFTVPSDHSVGIVTPFCGGLRFSVTGWFRDDEPPGDFGLLQK